MYSMRPPWLLSSALHLLAVCHAGAQQAAAAAERQVQSYAAIAAASERKVQSLEARLAEAQAQLAQLPLRQTRAGCRRS